MNLHACSTQFVTPLYTNCSVDLCKLLRQLKRIVVSIYANCKSDLYINLYIMQVRSACDITKIPKPSGYSTVHFVN